MATSDAQPTMPVDAADYNKSRDQADSAALRESLKALQAGTEPTDKPKDDEEPEEGGKPDKRPAAKKKEAKPPAEDEEGEEPAPKTKKDQAQRQQDEITRLIEEKRQLRRQNLLTVKPEPKTAPAVDPKWKEAALKLARAQALIDKGLTKQAAALLGIPEASYWKDFADGISDKTPKEALQAILDGVKLEEPAPVEEKKEPEELVTLRREVAQLREEKLSRAADEYVRKIITSDDTSFSRCNLVLDEAVERTIAAADVLVDEFVRVHKKKPTPEQTRELGVLAAEDTEAYFVAQAKKLNPEPKRRTREPRQERTPEAEDEARDYNERQRKAASDELRRSLAGLRTS
jgi:hypothetical protein